MELKLGWRWTREPDKRELRRQQRRQERRNPTTPTGLPHDGYCDQCGVRADAGDHAICTRRRELEPPRFCADCARRMVVQVTPTGWTAVCSRHGERHSQDAEPQDPTDATPVETDGPAGAEGPAGADATEQPGTEQPGTEQPGTEPPGTEPADADADAEKAS
jgi:hypothetical protein